MKSSKAQTHANFHKVPALRFDEQELTSFSGLVVFQALCDRLWVKLYQEGCLAHLKSSCVFGHHVVALLLVVHFLLGFKRLSDMGYYWDDPVMKRVLGLRRLPHVSTVSRTLAGMDAACVDNLRALTRDLVIDRLGQERFRRVTLDFDGTVLSTRRHSEGTAVGYNPKRKGARSYYPLLCTMAQTGQFFDMRHRPGNVHDLNGAKGFMHECFEHVRHRLGRVVLESRMDGAFFEKTLLESLDRCGVQFTCSVPFARFAELKGLIEERRFWKRLDREWAYFESPWKPKSWDRTFRFIFIPHKVKNPQKGPLQLDLFEPLDYRYEYTVMVTNRRLASNACDIQEPYDASRLHGRTR